MAVYGHYRWFRFRKVLETSQSGFTYEGRQYGWSDIERVDRTRRPFLLNLLLFLIGPIGSTANIHLKDGNYIGLNGLSLARNGQTPRLGLLGCFRGESDGYTELITLIESELAGS